MPADSTQSVIEQCRCPHFGRLHHRPDQRQVRTPAAHHTTRARLTAQGYEEISRVAVLEPTFPFGGKKVARSPPAYANRHIVVRNGKELICASLAAEP